MTLRFVGAAIALLALSGCATATAPGPGMSGDELATAQQRERDFQWDYTGLPDELRPPDVPMREVTLEEWAPSVVACMNAAGFDGYEAADGGYQYSVLEGVDESKRILAQYTCDTSIWVVDGFRYNGAQLDYLYDYYLQSFVPCLELRGGHVAAVPTRSEFYAELGWWHPLFALDEADANRVFADDSIAVECPVLPPGIDDPGYASLWDRGPATAESVAP